MDNGKTMADGTENSTYNKRPIWQWVIIYGVIAVILYGAIYYFFLAKNNNGGNLYQNPTPTPSTTLPNRNQGVELTTTPVASQPVIALTSNGFLPATLKIKRQEKVTWANQSGQVGNVSSDPHLLHTNYPLLNLGDFNNRQTVSLIFTESGTYGYHDNLNPQFEGKIIVE